ncbi:MAG: Dps family protein [Gemmatimonadota bacterium]|jgi:starvation-inducible DNA-binding protein
MTTDQQVIDGLNDLLADATVFYQKLRHFHWNVEGRTFFELHEKFEELYTGWADNIDEIAERILMVEGVPLHTLASMLKSARLKEEEAIPTAPEMVAMVLADLEAMHANSGQLVETADEAGDRGTANLLDDLRDGMEKDLWMLRAWKKETAAAWS